MTDPIRPTGGPAPTEAPPGQSGRPAAAGEPSPTFRTVLDSLERLLREKARPDEVHDAQDLRTAIARADEEYRRVMDLRRQLEEAFRQRLS